MCSQLVKSTDVLETLELTASVLREDSFVQD